MKMIGAIVRNEMVVNLIVLDEAQKAELEAALSCEIVDARPYGLIAGDLRTAKGWTRNAGGELLEQEAYDGYSLAVEGQKAAEARAEAAEEAVSSAAESGAQEAIDILSGNVEEG